MRIFCKTKGFTLIELLVVIGVLAVVASGVVALINPRDKILQAADAKVQSDIGQLATAMQAYAAQNVNGQYPPAGGCCTNTPPGNVLVTTGELTRMPVPPTQSAAYGTSYTYVTNGTTQTIAVVSGRVLSSKFASVCTGATSNAWWYWNSDNGRACGVCLGAGAPGTGTLTCSF